MKLSLRNSIASSLNHFPGGNAIHALHVGAFALILGLKKNQVKMTGNRRNFIAAEEYVKH